jgi:hypothetical protein
MKVCPPFCRDLLQHPTKPCEGICLSSSSRYVKNIALKVSRLRPLLLLITAVFRCRCVWNVGGMELTEQTQYCETNLSQCPWSAIIVTSIGPFSNPRLRSNRQITNPLSHCMDAKPKLTWTVFKIYFVLHSENTSFFKHRPIVLNEGIRMCLEINQFT